MKLNVLAIVLGMVLVWAVEALGVTARMGDMGRMVGEEDMLSEERDVRDGREVRGEGKGERASRRV